MDFKMLVPATEEAFKMNPVRRVSSRCDPQTYRNRASAALDVVASDNSRCGDRKKGEGESGEGSEAREHRVRSASAQRLVVAVVLKDGGRS